ncbi:MAG: hypothetical protein KDK39_13645 [Leptospiraceae bacterium]|nr:hypothetical protein [Leptospiraceae bacterium]
MKEIRRSLARMIAISLNADQANYIAEQLDGTFNLHRVAGFSTAISVPAQVAADTIVHYFQTEEELIKYFELMMGREGVFLFGATIHLIGRSDFIKLLEKKRWIYDTDLKQFLRDPFYKRSVNFLEEIRMLDLRRVRDLTALHKEIQNHTRNINTMDLEWDVTVRLYGMDRSIDSFLKSMVEFLLSKQNLASETFNIYSCMRELAVNASKANFKHAFIQSRSPDGQEQIEAADYTDILEDFKYEIESHGDSNLIALASQKDLFFDIIFKSNQHSIAIWVCNYVPIGKIEKERLVHRLHLNHFDNHSAFAQNDEHMEGAGLGLNLVIKILEHYQVVQAPVKAVFYPDSTKIGFLIDRNQLKQYQSHHGSL